MVRAVNSVGVSEARFGLTVDNLLTTADVVLADCLA